MCVIAVSKKGIQQPSMKQLETMFANNPDGAGYMFARDGEVIIHKGFMLWEDFERAVKRENFTKDDAVVYHFRISTQAGINPQMTHPFPLTKNRKLLEELDITCPVGLAHNGIIRMTSDIKETRFSDTAVFISDFMTRLIRKRSDITDASVTTMIENLTNSKWAILDGITEEIVTVGNFVNVNGLLFSNTSYLPRKYYWEA